MAARAQAVDRAGLALAGRGGVLVAAAVFLSPGRFRHLFVEQTGMGLRPYVLWRRFLRVWAAIMSGRSISTAAHEAGFADAAHLTRTSRRLFGVSPSMFRASHTPEALEGPKAPRPRGPDASKTLEPR